MVRIGFSSSKMKGEKNSSTYFSSANFLLYSDNKKSFSVGINLEEHFEHRTFSFGLSLREQLTHLRGRKKSKNKVKMKALILLLFPLILPPFFYRGNDDG